MTKKIFPEEAELRPHHLLCERFLHLDLKDRGEEFDRIEDAIKELLGSDGDTIIEVIEGVDALCRACPYCKNERCEHPDGNEEEVRKMDGIVLKGLGIKYGEKRNVHEFNMLISHKAPFDFCRTRCPWKANCSIFELNRKDF